jgi:hypothetical protein
MDLHQVVIADMDLLLAMQPLLRVVQEADMVLRAATMLKEAAGTGLEVHMVVRKEVVMAVLHLLVTDTVVHKPLMEPNKTSKSPIGNLVEVPDKVLSTAHTRTVN